MAASALLIDTLRKLAASQCTTRDAAETNLLSALQALAHDTGDPAVIAYVRQVTRHSCNVLKRPPF